MSKLVRTAASEKPVHLDRPQLLGIVPTYAFWNQREVWRRVGPAMAALAAVMVVAIGISMPPTWLGALLGALGPVLALGLFERYIRRRMKERAALAASGGGAALPGPQARE